MIAYLFYTAFSTQMMNFVVPNPSLITFEQLQSVYSATLRCPCTNADILYREFISLTPIFHQVCSSGFVTDEWLEILRNSYVSFGIESDWRNQAFSQFELLSHLCQYADQTVNDALHRFLLGSFVTSNVLTATNFNTQINVIVEEFLQSLKYFDFFVETTRLLTQIDQPFMGRTYPEYFQTDVNLFSAVSTIQMDDVEAFQVSFTWSDQCSTFFLLII